MFNFFFKKGLDLWKYKARCESPLQSLIEKFGYSYLPTERRGVEGSPLLVFLKVQDWSTRPREGPIWTGTKVLGVSSSLYFLDQNALLVNCFRPR